MHPPRPDVAPRSHGLSLPAVGGASVRVGGGAPLGLEATPREAEMAGGVAERAVHEPAVIGAESPRSEMQRRYEEDLRAAAARAGQEQRGLVAPPESNQAPPPRMKLPGLLAPRAAAAAAAPAAGSEWRGGNASRLTSIFDVDVAMLGGAAAGALQAAASSDPRMAAFLQAHGGNGSNEPHRGQDEWS
jgi:hypothetical protein